MSFRGQGSFLFLLFFSFSALAGEAERRPEGLFAISGTNKIIYIDRVAAPVSPADLDFRFYMGTREKLEQFAIRSARYLSRGNRILKITLQNGTIFSYGARMYDGKVAHPAYASLTEAGTNVQKGKKISSSFADLIRYGIDRFSPTVPLADADWVKWFQNPWPRPPTSLEFLRTSGYEVDRVFFAPGRGSLLFFRKIYYFDTTEAKTRTNRPLVFWRPLNQNTVYQLDADHLGREVLSEVSELMHFRIYAPSARDLSQMLTLTVEVNLDPREDMATISYSRALTPAEKRSLNVDEWTREIQLRAVDARHFEALRPMNTFVLFPNRARLLHAFQARGTERFIVIGGLPSSGTGELRWYFYEGTPGQMSRTRITDLAKDFPIIVSDGVRLVRTQNPRSIGLPKKLHLDAGEVKIYFSKSPEDPGFFLDPVIPNRDWIYTMGLKDFENLTEAETPLTGGGQCVELYGSAMQAPGA